MNKIAPFVAAFVTVLMASSFVTGCAVGPNYHRPDVQTPAAFRELTENVPVRRKPRPTPIFPGGKSSRIRSCKN